MLKTLAINSLPAYGHAGLKCVLSVLQNRVVPIPSLILSGLGNIPDHERYAYPFENNLFKTFSHLAANKDKVIVYVGYLGSFDQIAIISRALDEYRNIIESVIIDPVCGDNGKAYVPMNIIDGWASLLEKANWATPNVTEVQLLSKEKDLQKGIDQLQRLFPAVQWIITSYPYSEDAISNRLITDAGVKNFTNKKLNHKISGAGDTFTSLFIKTYFYDQQPLDCALKSATTQTLDMVSLEI